MSWWLVVSPIETLRRLHGAVWAHDADVAADHLAEHLDGVRTVLVERMLPLVLSVRPVMVEFAARQDAPLGGDAEVEDRRGVLGLAELQLDRAAHRQGAAAADNLADELVAGAGDDDLELLLALGVEFHVTVGRDGDGDRVVPDLPVVMLGVSLSRPSSCMTTSSNSCSLVSPGGMSMAARW
jgi:hypothetical protein